MSQPNIDDWLNGARRPRRSVTIYQRPDLLADIDAIDQQAAVTTDPSTLADLSEQFETVRQQIIDSGLTITMEAVPQGELQAIKDEADIDGCTSEALASRQMARAIVEPKMTPDQILGMADKIGQAQVAKLTAAYVLVTKMPVEPPDERQPDDAANSEDEAIQ